LLKQAWFVVGGRRHLELAGPLDAETYEWPSPIEQALDVIEARRGTPTCVLTSGDPFFFGAGAMLMRRFRVDETLVAPAPSAFSLAAARLGWSQQDCALISLHGRPLEAIIPYLQPGAKILALSWDEATPAELAALLSARGMGGSRLTICEAMGGARERVRAASAEDFALPDIVALNTIALEVAEDASVDALPLAPGLPDEWFETDGQLTKRDVRAITLSALAPRRGETLWDIGAGSGSVAIEWMLADPANHAVAVEMNPERAQRIVRNSLMLGVPNLAVLLGEAPEALSDLPAPDAVFVGGGATVPTVIERAWAALRSGGRLVVNAVTLETERLCAAGRVRYGGELVRIAVEHAEPLGGFTRWRPASPIVQWRCAKP
jgi:precorrin-6Y C5,15-methyltransferase (decarboxylating)